MAGGLALSDSRDNRKYSRISARLRCWCESDSVTFYARIGNISEGGLFLRTSTPLQQGVRTRVRLGDPATPSLDAEALVVWARAEEQGGPAGMGLQFDALDEGSRGRLKEIIAQQQRMNGATAD